MTFLFEGLCLMTDKFWVSLRILQISFSFLYALNDIQEIFNKFLLQTKTTINVSNVLEKEFSEKHQSGYHGFGSSNNRKKIDFPNAKQLKIKIKRCSC